MEITLANFEQIIDPTILRQGRRYIDGGNAGNLAEMDTGSWVAMIGGNNPYSVLVTIAHDESLSWSCVCPYDLGPVCEHVAAALYALEARGASAPAKKRKPRKKRKTRTDKILDVLRSLSKGQLTDLLLDLALDDRELAHLILTRFGPDEDNKGAYARLVKDALRLGKGRHGFIDYWGAARAAEGVGELLSRADTHLAQARPLQAIPIYQAVIEKVVPAMAHADDSMGGLGDCIETALDGLGRAAEKLSPPERANLFAYCVGKASIEPYTDWDWGWDLAGIAADLTVTPKQRSRLFATLDQMAARHEDARWGNDYDQERAGMIKLSVIRRLDDDTAVQAFLEEHIRHEKMRMALARFHLQHGDLAAARRLCDEWLNKPPENKPGLRPDFLAILLDVAEAADDREEQIRLVEMLFRQTGRIEFYERLKKLIGTDEWQAYRPGFLERMRQGSGVWVNLGALYVAEEMWEDLLAYVQDNPRAARQYREYLAPRFPRELGEVYERLALETLEQNVNRKGYRVVCGYLKQMLLLGEGERVAELVAGWRVKYKQRPALLDELNKAFGGLGKTINS